MAKTSHTEVNPNLQENYTHYYEDGASEWRRICAVDKVENLRRLCADLAINSVIEVGAGEGSVTQRMSEVGFAQEYVALEISQSGLDTLKTREIPELTECQLFDGYNIPYEDKRFDLAVLSHVVEHVEYPRKLLYEVRRVARYVFVEVPLEATFRQPEDFVLDAVGHINFYSPKTIRRLLQSSGLRVLKQSVLNPSRSVYTFSGGSRGALRHLFKSSLLRVAPSLATELFTYHSALICEDGGDLELPGMGAH